MTRLLAKPRSALRAQVTKALLWISGGVLLALLFHFQASALSSRGPPPPSRSHSDLHSDPAGWAASASAKRVVLCTQCTDSFQVFIQGVPRPRQDSDPSSTTTTTTTTTTTATAAGTATAPKGRPIDLGTFPLHSKLTVHVTLPCNAQGKHPEAHYPPVAGLPSLPSADILAELASDSDPDSGSDSESDSVRAHTYLAPFAVCPDAYHGEFPLEDVGRFSLNLTVEFLNYEWNQDGGLPCFYDPIPLDPSLFSLQVSGRAHRPSSPVAAAETEPSPRSAIGLVQDDDTSEVGVGVGAGAAGVSSTSLGPLASSAQRHVPSHARQGGGRDLPLCDLGGTAARGRWVRDGSGMKDDWGYTWKPYGCRLAEYGGVEDLHRCMRSKGYTNVLWFGDSNSRRDLKLLSRTDWCDRNQAQCFCEDWHEGGFEWGQTPDVPARVDDVANVTFYFTGPLTRFNTPGVIWKDVMKKLRAAGQLERPWLHSAIIAAAGAWDTASTRSKLWSDAIEEYAAELNRTFASAGVPVIFRSGQPFCCRHYCPRMFTGFRNRAWNRLFGAAARKYGFIWWDVELLENHLHQRSIKCKQNHAAPSLVRMELMLLHHVLCSPG